MTLTGKIEARYLLDALSELNEGEQITLSPIEDEDAYEFILTDADFGIIERIGVYGINH